MFLRSKQLVFLRLILLFIATLPNENLPAQVLRENKALNQLFDDYYENRLKLFPLEATDHGDTRYKVAEVERYMAWPGQALSYKIGELKIEELRDKYKAQLAEKFSLKYFHDAVLNGGALPLNVFESYTDYWAQMQK